MTMFKTYTGNALLNNALMTIEAIGKLKNVSEITPELILELYQKEGLKSLNQRLKSYTMLFSLNNPLVNPAKKKDNVGETTYDSLLRRILNNYENDGKKICEISGLKFSKTFEEVYLEEIDFQKEQLKKRRLPEKEEKKALSALSNADLSINRTWFPLIGGLGSDAQALPQAKFSVQIHPIIIPILQFLPLSAVLYKGRILLVDSANFEFSREFIARNVKDVKQRIAATQEGDPIENLKDYAKGNYLLRAIKILEERDEDYENDYTDLNLWSFSNSGTGASCEIERVPNSLLQKVFRLKKDVTVRGELKQTLSSSETAYRFLEALENNHEWYGLYPNVFGSGVKKVESNGVSVPFLEAYFKEINSPQKTEYAKYLAFLLEKYKTESFAKYLPKKDAWRDQNFKTDLYSVLVKATENGEWSLAHQLEILDDPDAVPVKNNVYGILKITHYYHYKKVFSEKLPEISQPVSETKNITDWLIALIQADARKENLVKSLTNSQTVAGTGYTQLFYRASQKPEVDLETVFYALYNEQFKSARYGLNELLRLFFSQPEQEEIGLFYLEKRESWQLEKNTRKWFGQFAEFAADYQRYYFHKYGNPETGSKPFGKFLKLTEGISEDGSHFLTWFYEAFENTNQFLIDQELVTKEKWTDSLLYAPNGGYMQSFARMAIKLSLLKSIHTLQPI